MTNPASALRAALTAHQAAGGSTGPLWSGPCVLACYALANDVSEVYVDAQPYDLIAESLGVTFEYIEGVAAGWDAAYTGITEDLSGESRDVLRGFGIGYMLAREAQRAS